MNIYKLGVIIVVSLLVAILLASALNSYTRVSDSALANNSLLLQGGGRGGDGGNAPRTAPGKNYLPIIFLNSATAGGAWLLAGNSGTNPASDFLGTTDKVTFTIRVSNTVAYRIAPAVDPFNAFAPNIIGGSVANTIGAGLYGATIAGGGASGFSNVITAFGDYATIGGGASNTASSLAPTIGGGYGNHASNDYATVGGGNNNTASNNYATIGGGYGNHASSFAATVASGYNNTASGSFATIPGGFSNSATMTLTFAAGNQAQALHQGAFVWADSIDSPFASTANNQFLIRANGGVGIGTNNPGAQLHISSSGGPSNPQVRIDQTNASDYARLRFKVGSASYWDIAVGDSTSDVMNVFKSGTGNVMSLSGGSTHITMIDNATESGGMWNNASDRNLKTNFSSVDVRDILARVNALPIQTWNYKSEDALIRHLGPMAQDFFSAFTVGEDDKHISTVDAQGVALAAIQGLYQENQDLKAQVTSLQSRNVSLDVRVASQQEQLDAVNARLSALEQGRGFLGSESPTQGQGQANALPISRDALFVGAVIVVVGFIAVGRRRRA